MPCEPQLTPAKSTPPAPAATGGLHAMSGFLIEGTAPHPKTSVLYAWTATCYSKAGVRAS